MTSSPVAARPPAPRLDPPEDDEPNSHPVTPLADQTIPDANREILATMEAQRRNFWTLRGISPARLQIQEEAVRADEGEEKKTNYPETPPQSPNAGGGEEALIVLDGDLVDLSQFQDSATPKGS